jgi:outer membrane lipoprotein-sorting protein
MKIRLFLTLSFLLLPLSIQAQTFDAKDLIRRADDLLRGDTSNGSYKMEVRTPSWSRTLKLNAISQGKNKTFIKIIEPPKEAGITTLRVDNNMWNYLPKVERTIKIPPSMMLEAWMGSDFSNDDLVKESSIVNDYTQKIVGEEQLGGANALKIELIPNPGAAVAWGKLLYWVTTPGNIPLKEEFYDEHGKLIKTLAYSRIKKMSDRNIPTIWTMQSNVKPGNITTIEILEVVYNKPVDESVFSLQNLRK